MKKINIDEMLELLTCKSNLAFSPERIIGTIKIHDQDSWLFYHILYFDSYSLSCQDEYPWDDKIFALYYDSLEEYTDLICITFRDLFELSGSLYHDVDVFWDCSDDNCSWWLKYYEYNDILNNTDSIMNFYWGLELKYRSTFDLKFMKFAKDSGYTSVNRNKTYECILDFKDNQIASLEHTLSQYSGLFTLPVEEDLPF